MRRGRGETGGGEFMMYFNAPARILHLHSRICMQWYSVKPLKY
jgi:hypothetical protein